MQLSTLAKLKSHLGIPTADTSKDALLGVILTGASRFVETQTARKLELASHDEKYDGDGTDTLMLDQWPVLMDGSDPVLTITIDDVALTDIDIDAEKGIVYRTSGRFPVGRRNVRVVYTAGYELPGDSGESGNPDELPEDLELAAIRIAARIYERRTAEGVSSVSTTGFTANYKDALDEDIEATLGSHSRQRVG